MELKTCTCCKEAKLVSEFYKKKKGSDEPRSICKACNGKKERQWRDENPERNKAKNDEWREKNADKHKAYNEAWKERNKEKEVERQRRWAQENAERHNAKGQRWRKENPERAKQIWEKWRTNNPEKVRAANNRRRAAGELDPAIMPSLYENQKGLCAYCDCELGDKYHLDHIVPIVRGGTNERSNLCLACPFCNLSKGGKLLEEWETPKDREYLMQIANAWKARHRPLSLPE